MTLVKGSMHEEDITIINYTPLNNIAPEYRKPH